MTMSIDDWLDIDTRTNDWRGTAAEAASPRRKAAGGGRTQTLLAELREAPPLAPQVFLEAANKALEATRCKLMCAASLAYRNPALPLTPLENCYATRGGLVSTTIYPPKPGIDACLLGTAQGLFGVSTQKDVVLAFRGTLPVDLTSPTSVADWVNSFEALPARLRADPRFVVHKGFNDSLEVLLVPAIVEQIKSRLAELPGSKLYITGHSKGGAVAHLAAYSLHRLEPSIRPRIGGVVSFEAPRCADQAFVDAYKGSGISALRYEFQDDIVPHLPPSTELFQVLKNALAPLNTALSSMIPKSARDLGWRSAGELRFIDWDNKVCTDTKDLPKERFDRFSRLPKNPLTLYKTLVGLHQIDSTSGHWKSAFNATVCP